MLDISIRLKNESKDGSVKVEFQIVNSVWNTL